MRITLLRTASMVLLLLATGPGPAAGQTPPALTDAVRKADIGWNRVFAAKKMEESLDYCAVDGSVLAPNAPIATGRSAIRALFAEFFKLPELKIKWVPSKAGVAESGDLGYTSGEYQMTFKDQSGSTVSDKGKYVTVWKKQADGKWKVYLDIFNSDIPAVGAARSSS